MGALLLILFVVTVLGFTAAISDLSDDRLPVINPELCANCGYSLLGLPSPGRCPECGESHPSTTVQIPVGVPSTPARLLFSSLPRVAIAGNFLAGGFLALLDSIATGAGAAIMGCVPLALALATTSAAALRRPTFELGVYSVGGTLAAWVPAILGGILSGLDPDGYFAGGMIGILLVMAVVAILWGAMNVVGAHVR